MKTRESGMFAENYWDTFFDPPRILKTLKSVFRLAARRTGLSEGAPQSRAAPVSEKRIGLTRRHLSRGDLHAMQTRALWN